MLGEVVGWSSVSWRDGAGGGCFCVVVFENRDWRLESLEALAKLGLA